MRYIYLPPWRRVQRWTYTFSKGQIVKDRNGNPVLRQVWQRVLPVRLVEEERPEPA